jgi:hypothetical protein
MSTILSEFELSWQGVHCNVVHRGTGETVEGPFSSDVLATRWIEEQGPVYLSMLNQRARAREEAEGSSE